MQSINEILAKELNIYEKQVKSVVELLDDGNTVPFIARYRKEKTGGFAVVQERVCAGYKYHTYREV